MGKGLYFYSKTKGSGKTLLSIAITNELIIKYKIKPVYISVVNMLNEMKHSFSSKDSNRTFYSLMESFKHAPLLVMDDLGVEKTTDWSEEVLTQIIDERMSYKRPTIKAQQENYRYNFIGLFAVMMNKPLQRKNAFFRSEFIASVLEQSDKIEFNTPISLVKPYNIMELEELEIVYQGKFCHYNRKTVDKEYMELSTQFSLC